TRADSRRRVVRDDRRRTRTYVRVGVAFARTHLALEDAVGMGGSTPEPVPLVEVEKVLRAGFDPAVLDHEHDATVGVKPPILACARAVVQADHPPVVTLEHPFEVDSEGPVGLVAV